MNICKPIILLVDDDNRIRELLYKYLCNNGYLVLTAGEALEATRLINEFQFDLIILDVMMPGKSGLDLAQELKNKIPTPIIILTAMGDASDRITGLENGADDYMVKPFEPKELILRINKILERLGSKALIDSNIIKFGDFTFDLKNLRLSKSNEIIFLTTNEMNLLNLFITKRGIVISREEISRIFDGINIRSIDVQITRLRIKIENDPKNPYFLRTVRGKGYIFSH